MLHIHKRYSMILLAVIHVCTHHATNVGGKVNPDARNVRHSIHFDQ